MKTCPICGITEMQATFKGNYCYECYKKNRMEKYKENRAKEKAKKVDKLEQTCEEAYEEGLTYAQYQIRETCEMLRRRRD